MVRSKPIFKDLAMIIFKLEAKHKAEIEQAAHNIGMNTASFVRFVALREAARVNAGEKL